MWIFYNHCFILYGVIPLFLLTTFISTFNIIDEPKSQVQAQLQITKSPQDSQLRAVTKILWATTQTYNFQEWEYVL